MTSSISAASGTQLTIEDLSTVHDALTTVAHKILTFGSKISVPHHILAGIEKSNYDFDEKLYKVLEYRLKQLPLLTWHDIVRALRSPAVHEQVLASEIESQYIPCASSQSQLASDQSSAPIGPDSSANNIIFESQPFCGQHPQSLPHTAFKGKQKRSHWSSSQAHSCTVEPNPFESHSSSTQTLVPGAPPAKRPHLQQGCSPPLYNVECACRELFQQFTESVKSFYRCSPVEMRTQVLKLPTPGQKFINLACIDRKTNKPSMKEYEEITEAMVRDGNVDVIEGRKCPIDMNKIAANLPATTLATVILVEGAPGVGKSTFAWEFCRRWERGEIAQQYDLVLLLRLRDDRVSKAKCWKDFIYHSSQSIRQAVISELEAGCGFGVLFILEGYDELPDECRHPSSTFLRLISGEELPLARLMITSRPWATCDVLKRFKHRIFQHIEVLGFTNSQISSYIQSVLSEEEVEDLEKKLLKHDQIRKCMYIPLNCAIVVTVYQESKASGDDMPSTLTELYLALSRTILLRYLRANDIYSDPIEYFNELPPAVHKKFSNLCKLAYSGVVGTGKQVRLIFSDLPPDFDGLGFTDSVFELYVTRKAVASHNFLHLTFQEFLAAVHISNMEPDKRFEHFKLSKDSRLKVVLMFLAGLTSLKDLHSSNFIDVLNDRNQQSNTTIDFSVSTQLSWVFEARRGELVRDTFGENATVEFTCEDQFDSSALGYCIANSCCKWVLSIQRRIMEDDTEQLVNEIKNSHLTGGVVIGLRGKIDKGFFRGMAVSLEALNMLYKELNMQLNELVLNLPAPCSNISWPNLSSLKYLTIYTDRIIVLDLDFFLPHLSLEVLTIVCELLSEDCLAVANHVANATCLKKLSFPAINKQRDMALEDICAALLENVSYSLNALDFSGVLSISDDTAEKLSEFILRDSYRLDILFPYQALSANGALKVVKALRNTSRPVCVNKFTFYVLGPNDTIIFTKHINDYFECFDISRGIEFKKIGNNGAEKLGEYLNRDSIIKELKLGDNSISNIGVEHLARSLYDNKTLVDLYLMGNYITDDGAEALALALKSNTTLERLDLGDNRIGDKGAKALAEALHQNGSLKSLNLGKNPGIGGEGIYFLIQALTVNMSITCGGVYDGLVLDIIKCTNYACKCPKYSRVRHRVSYYQDLPQWSVDSSQTSSSTVHFEPQFLTKQTLVPGAPSGRKPHLQQCSLPSLSNVDSGRRELFQQFTESVKSLYRSSAVEVCTQVLKLPTSREKFINLACIDRKTEGLRTEYDEITEAMVRDGNVDVIHGRKCPIDLNKIAADLPATTFETVILVEGAPGVGKSTFSWEFCRRWERGEIAQQYDLVLLLQLRDDRISKAKYWKDLIYHSSPSILQAVISELEARSGFRVLFILEGYDELPDECRHPSSPLLKLISGEELHLATLMITSRPWATCDVLKKFKHRIFQHIEVLGFTKSQISSYIQSVLSEKEVEDLEKKLLKHGQIRKCMYIPLNCAIVVMVYQESKASGDNMPSTMTELYLALSRTILLRYLCANDPYSDPIDCFEELPPGVHKKFKYLCKLAYSSVAEAGDQVRLIFSDLPPDFDGLGFMDSVFELYITRKAVASHNFLHLTFQEFLAAVHISNMEAEQRLQHYKRHKEGRLRVVLRFLAGITKLKDFSTPSSFVVLLDQPIECGYTAIDYTIRPHVCTWVYEALGKEIIKTAFHEDVTLEFACGKLSDSAALGYCIAHSCCKWVLCVSSGMEKEDVDILVDESQASDSTGGVIVGLRCEFDDELDTYYGLRFSFTELNIFTGRHIRLSELVLELPAKCSQISWPELSSLQSLTIDTTTYYEEDETMDWELDYLLPQLSLSSLTLLFHPSLLSFEDSKAVANYITNTPTLKYLHILVYCPLIGMDEIFAAMIEKEVHPTNTLEILADEIDNEDAKQLASYIRSTALSKLILLNLQFSAFGALQVARALRDVPYLNADKLCFDLYEPSDFYHAIELTDYFNLMGKDMQEMKIFLEYDFCFSFLLPDSTTVEWRFELDCEINDVEAQHMAEAVRNNSSVKALGLCGYCISDVGAKALAEVFNCNTILEELDLSCNNIGDVGAEALAQAIWSNTTLKRLYLCNNDIGNIGAKALARVLNFNTIVEKLDLSQNKIGSVGVVALAEAIKSNTALKKLDVSENNIGDVGAKALAEILKYNTILEELYLLCSGIGDVGAEALAEAIVSNTALNKLVLSYNDIGDVGAKALAEVLNCNTILEELYLSWNKIGIVGIKALAQAIGPNTTLKELGLTGNDVSDDGAKALAQALHSNSCLDVLKFSGNCIGDSGAKAFAEALHHNSTITHLDLSANNDIGEEGVHQLIQALTVNDSISENGLELYSKGSKYALNCSGYKNVKHKILWCRVCFSQYLFLRHCS